MSQVPKELHALSLEEPQLTPKINKKCKTIENIWTMKDCDVSPCQVRFPLIGQFLGKKRFQRKGTIALDVQRNLIIIS